MFLFGFLEVVWSFPSKLAKTPREPKNKKNDTPQHPQDLLHPMGLTFYMMSDLVLGGDFSLLKNVVLV